MCVCVYERESTSLLEEEVEGEGGGEMEVQWNLR